MKLKCEGHDEIEGVNTCESAQQNEIRRQLDAEDAAQPKRDRRFLARNAPLRKTRKETN